MNEWVGTKSNLKSAMTLCSGALSRDLASRFLRDPPLHSNFCYRVMGQALWRQTRCHLWQRYINITQHERLEEQP